MPNRIQMRKTTSTRIYDKNRIQLIESNSDICSQSKRIRKETENIMKLTNKWKMCKKTKVNETRDAILCSV